MHPAPLVAIVIPVCGQAPSSVSAKPGVEVEGVARIQIDAKALADRVTTELAKEFLLAMSTLPPVPKRTLYLDPVKKTYSTETEAARLDAQKL